MGMYLIYPTNNVFNQSKYNPYISISAIRIIDNYRQKSIRNIHIQLKYSTLKHFCKKLHFANV